MLLPCSYDRSWHRHWRFGRAARCWARIHPASVWTTQHRNWSNPTTTLIPMEMTPRPTLQGLQRSMVVSRGVKSASRLCDQHDRCRRRWSKRRASARAKTRTEPSLFAHQAHGRRLRIGPRVLDHPTGKCTGLAAAATLELFQLSPNYRRHPVAGRCTWYWDAWAR